MPAPGDQHKSALVNPFEEPKLRISEYTAQEIATLQHRLDKQLGPEFISSRPGAGGQKVHYLAAEKCINLANEVFGFNGWSSAIREVQVDFVDENVTTGKISLGLSVIVRITLRDGAFHEDIGYGHIENCKGKAAAFEKAKKEGTTDAMKRALRSFGNVLGNCVYDKDYVAKVTKMKVAPTRFDADNLHRHAEYAPIKKESMDDGPTCRIQVETQRPLTLEADDEFGSADFDEADFSVAERGHPDEVATAEPLKATHFSKSASPLKIPQSMAPQLPAAPNPSAGRPPPTTRGQPQNSHHPGGPGAPNNGNGGAMQQHPNMQQRAPNTRSQQSNAPMQYPNTAAQRSSYGQAQEPQQRPQTIPTQQAQQYNAQQYNAHPNGGNNGITPAARQLAQLNANEGTSLGVENAPPEGEAPVTFYTARVAESLQSGKKPSSEAATFNPRLESPSIRKTVGIDHNSTKPILRDLAVGATSPASPAMNTRSNNFVNPHLDPARRVGMPPALVSPLQNRNSFRQPSMKRPADGNAQQNGRSALNDVTNVSATTPIENQNGAKRQRVGNGSAAPGDGTNVVSS